MDGICRMKKGGRGAGGVQGGDDLLGNDGALPDPADDDPAPGGQYQLYRFLELIVEKFLQGGDGCSFLLMVLLAIEIIFLAPLIDF